MFRKLFGSLLLGGALFAACSSPAPSTSSSSHWVKCHDVDDCAALTNAVACTSGYCVDSAGSRLSNESSSGLVACNDGTGDTDCCPPDAVEDGPCEHTGVKCSRGGCHNGNESFLYCGESTWSAGKGAFPCTVPVADGGSSAGPCDPLTPHELPVTLGTIHGIGTAPDGTTYLSDSVTTPTTADRVFVSDGDTLVRQRVNGTGEGGGQGGAEEFTFSFDRGDGPESLLAEVKDGKTTAMGLGSGGKGFIGDPGAVTTMLTVKDPSSVASFKLKNLPGAVTIEYVADAIDGTVIVVTHPTDDYTYDDFRLFWGHAADLVERKVDSVMRTRGSDTDIVFEVGPSGGDTLTAHFAFVLEPSDAGTLISHPGPGELMGPGTPDGFTQRWPTPTTLSGLSFTCR